MFSHLLCNTLFESAEKGEVGIIIPTKVLAEVGYLSEKRRIEANLNDIRKYCIKYKSFIIEPITVEIIEKAFEIDDIPE